MAIVTDLRIYPVKSLPPAIVSSARVLESGALEFDRRWAFVDEAGRYWNAKRTPLMHQFRCEFDPATLTIRLSTPDQGTVTWGPGESPQPLEDLAARVLGGQVRLHEAAAGGFPDDTESRGPTVVSTATLATIAGWFPGLTTEHVRERLRANIEIGEVEPFWEDRLSRGDRQPQPFRVGNVTFAGTTVCQRCAVPARDQQTGEVWPGFQKQFAQHRQASLPPWAAPERFSHYYRATINTCLVDRGGQTISVGDTVELVS